MILTKTKFSFISDNLDDDVKKNYQLFSDVLAMIE